MSNFLNRKEVDRLPMIEWAIWWDKTIQRWQTEGMPFELYSKEMKQGLGLDYDNQTWFYNGLHAAQRLKQNDLHGNNNDGYIDNEENYEQIKPYIFDKETVNQWSGQIKLSDYLENLKKHEEAGDIVWFTLEGFFWLPRVLFGIEDHLLSFYDYPELYHRICQDATDYYLFLIDEITKYISPSFMTFGEDMSYNNGPMLSEDMFNEFIKPYYDQIIPKLHEKGIKVIVDSDGDITKLIPWLINAGVDGILPLERQAGTDVNILTKQYPDFLFVGGFDKMVMKNGKEAISKEFERLAPAIKRGNFLPSVDHQTPPDVSFEQYQDYIELFGEFAKSINDK